MLAAIWGTTLNLINVERTAAEQTAAVASRELAETYESQVIRALREIDQTLKTVQYRMNPQGSTTCSPSSRQGIYYRRRWCSRQYCGRQGRCRGKHPAIRHKANVADQEFFKTQRPTDALWVGRPQEEPGTGEWRLHVQSQARLAPDGKFAGVVMVAVDAAYFVSGYEPPNWASMACSACSASDGVFRVRRSGETVVCRRQGRLRSGGAQPRTKRKAKPRSLPIPGMACGATPVYGSSTISRWP